MLPHEAPEPFAQAPRLSRDLVEFARQGARAHRLEHIGRHQLRLLQPAQIPSPSSIQSMAASTGVATEFRKSSPGASPTKIAGGRGPSQLLLRHGGRGLREPP